MKNYVFTIKAAFLAFLTVASFSLFAQDVNCDLPAGSGGTIADPGVTDVCPGNMSPTLSLTGVDGSIGVTEYVYTNPNDITTNATGINGPRVLLASNSSSIDPTTLGLSEGDQFCVTAVTYDKSALQAFHQELLSGSFLGTTCCQWAISITGLDPCGDYAEASVTSGASFTDLNIVTNVIEVFGSEVSIANYLNFFDSLNIQAGQPVCVVGLPICYATSNTVCYDVACAPAACSPSYVPEGLVSNVTPAGNSVQLSWPAVPGADFYQAKGRRVGTTPFGQFVTPNTNKNVGGLNFATSYEWYIRARCEATGAVTQFSAFDTFTTGPPSKLASADLSPELKLTPNPASDLVEIQFSSFIEDGAKMIVTDLSGREMIKTDIMDMLSNASLQIDVSDLDNGSYIVEIHQSSSKVATKLVVAR